MGSPESRSELSGEYQEALSDCEGNLAITRNWDRNIPSCLPAIQLCAGFFSNSLYLSQRSAQDWCSVDFDTSDPDQDQTIKTHFDTFAITLLHEITHADAVVAAALGPGKLGLGGLGEEEHETEIYLHSECRHLDVGSSEENAESHALAWTGKPSEITLSSSEELPKMVWLNDNN